MLKIEIAIKLQVLPVNKKVLKQIPKHCWKQMAESLKIKIETK